MVWMEAVEYRGSGRYHRRARHRDVSAALVAIVGCGRVAGFQFSACPGKLIGEADRRPETEFRSHGGCGLQEIMPRLHLRLEPATPKAWHFAGLGCHRDFVSNGTRLDAGKNGVEDLQVVPNAGLRLSPMHNRLTEMI